MEFRYGGVEFGFGGCGAGAFLGISKELGFLLIFGMYVM